MPEGTSPSPSDGWGESTGLAEPVEGVPRRRRRRLLVAGMVLPLAALVGMGVFFAVRQRAIQSLSRSCREAYQEKDWTGLERLAARWQDWDQEDASPLLYLAQAACETGRYGEAVALLDRLPQADPAVPQALLEKSSILFKALNRPIEGAEALEEALRLDPQLIEARRRIIYYYAFTLQRDKVVRHAHEAMRHEAELPETYVYLIARDWLSFSNAYSENVKWLAGNPDEELFLVARSLYLVRTRAALEDETPDLKRENVREEDTVPYHRKLLARLFQRFPHNLELRSYYVEEAIEKGNADEVARLLAAAPPGAVDDNRFWRYTGWLHAARGNLEEAENCCRNALALNGYDYVARFQLAGIHRRLRKLDQVKALEDLWRRGKELRQEILQIERVDKIPQPMMRRIAKYAKDCGDELAWERLQVRFWELKDAPGGGSSQ